MGVKDLWSILAPVSHKQSFYDIQDKVVAIDLSCWVCEGQSVGDKVGPAQPRMYLRTLFFRTYTLLMMNVTPIFILEGDAPVLKLNVMKQRNDTRFKRYQNASDDEHKISDRQKGKRSHFKGVLNQCRQMLQMMGVTCLQSQGEAEALCGQLNRDGVASAVITQDSDVFLYGAHTVYRNISIKAGTGTVDVYEMEDIETKLHLTRHKLVAMSLLCGCDYDHGGVYGVGKELAYNFLSSLEGDVLQRLRTWRHDPTLERLEEEKNGCIKCCHPGKNSLHKKGGCETCGTDTGCADNTSPLAFKNLEEEVKKRVILELSVRKKALSTCQFPNEETISEYLSTRQPLPSFDPTWKKPHLCRLVHFCHRMLEWELDYGFEKVLPLTTRWLLLKSPAILLEELVPNEIVKKRIVKGVASFDLSWRVKDENVAAFFALVPPDSSFLSEGLCVTTEPHILVSERLPELFALFIEKTTKKKPVKVQKEKKLTKGSKKSVKSKKVCEEELILPQPGSNGGNSNKNESPLSGANGSRKITETFDASCPSPLLDEFTLFNDTAIHYSTPSKEKPSRVSDREPCKGNELDLEQLSWEDTTIVISDESTQDYDVSAIVDDIISRKFF